MVGRHRNPLSQAIGMPNSPTRGAEDEWFSPRRRRVSQADSLVNPGSITFQNKRRFVQTRKAKPLETTGSKRGSYSYNVQLKGSIARQLSYNLQLKRALLMEVWIHALLITI